MSSNDLLRAFTAMRASVLGYLRVLVRDPHLAEDLFQETSLVVIRKIEAFDPSADLGAWVRGIALNLARNALRKETYLHLSPSPELFQALQVTYDAASRNETAEHSDRLEYLARCMEKIESRQRAVLELRYNGGASLKNIAAQLGRTPEAVQVALSRIRQFLLRCIEQQKAIASHG